ncbi:MAG: hypothetical protein WBP63_21130 [Silvibacterium sp.]
MSIPRAVAELNEEIERLTKIRDSLLQGASETEPPRRVTVATKKATAAKKSVAVKKSTPPKKRTMSAAGRKRISDAAKARWAAKRKAAPSK